MSLSFITALTFAAGGSLITLMVQVAAMKVELRNHKERITNLEHETYGQKT